MHAGTQRGSVGRRARPGSARWSVGCPSRTRSCYASHHAARRGATEANRTFALRHQSRHSPLDCRTVRVVPSYRRAQPSIERKPSIVLVVHSTMRIPPWAERTPERRPGIMSGRYSPTASRKSGCFPERPRPQRQERPRRCCAVQSREVKRPVIKSTGIAGGPDQPGLTRYASRC